MGMIEIRVSYQCSLPVRRIRAFINQLSFIFYLDYLIRNNRVYIFIKGSFDNNLGNKFFALFFCSREQNKFFVSSIFFFRK